MSVILDTEIVDSFRRARRKREQIKILAHLNACDVETIITILHEAGEYCDIATCKGCGKRKKRYLYYRCWDCFWKIAEDRERIERDNEIIRYRMKENAIRAKVLLREAAQLTAENERLKGEIR